MHSSVGYMCVHLDSIYIRQYDETQWVVVQVIFIQTAGSSQSLMEMFYSVSLPHTTHHTVGYCTMCWLHVLIFFYTSLHHVIFFVFTTVPFLLLFSFQGFRFPRVKVTHSFSPTGIFSNYMLDLLCFFFLFCLCTNFLPVSYLYSTQDMLDKTRQSNVIITTHI